MKENEKDQLVLLIPVQDKDLVNTPNWVSKFVITKGNENGNFRIDTDPKTNGGRLYVSKVSGGEVGVGGGGGRSQRPRLTTDSLPSRPWITRSPKV